MSPLAHLQYITLPQEILTSVLVPLHYTPQPLVVVILVSVNAALYGVTGLTHSNIGIGSSTGYNLGLYSNGNIFIGDASGKGESDAGRSNFNTFVGYYAGAGLNGGGIQYNTRK